MTKRHLEAIAEIISQNRFEGSRKEACRSIAEDMADMFAEENPRFDREMFLTACGFVE